MRRFRGVINKLVKNQRFIGCCLVIGLLLGGCTANDLQSKTVPIDRAGIDASGVVQLLDGNRAYELCGVIAPDGFRDEAKAKIETLLKTPDSDVVVQGATTGTYEAFVITSQGERSIEEELLRDGLLITTEDVSNCPNGPARIPAETIAREKKLGVWAVSPPVSSQTS